MCHGKEAARTLLKRCSLQFFRLESFAPVKNVVAVARNSAYYIAVWIYDHKDKRREGNSMKRERDEERERLLVSF